MHNAKIIKYIRTKTEPSVFYIPAKMCSATQKLLEDSQKRMNGKRQTALSRFCRVVWTGSLVPNVQFGERLIFCFGPSTAMLEERREAFAEHLNKMEAQPRRLLLRVRERGEPRGGAPKTEEREEGKAMGQEGELQVTRNRGDVGGGREVGIAQNIQERQAEMKEQMEENKGGGEEEEDGVGLEEGRELEVEQEEVETEGQVEDEEGQESVVPVEMEVGNESRQAEVEVEGDKQPQAESPLEPGSLENGSESCPVPGRSVEPDATQGISGPAPLALPPLRAGPEAGSEDGERGQTAQPGAEGPAKAPDAPAGGRARAAARGRVRSRSSTSSSSGSSSSSSSGSSGSSGSSSCSSSSSSSSSSSRGRGHARDRNRRGGTSNRDRKRGGAPTTRRRKPPRGGGRDTKGSKDKGTQVDRKRMHSEGSRAGKRPPHRSDRKEKRR